VSLLARVEGLPLREVAERLGRTPNAVAQLLSRALRKLGRSLGQSPGRAPEEES
jgi:DNA-directed RNA polymerase specialized sigma24 family protein